LHFERDFTPCSHGPLGYFVGGALFRFVPLFAPSPSLASTFTSSSSSASAAISARIRSRSGRHHVVILPPRPSKWPARNLSSTFRSFRETWLRC